MFAIDQFEAIQIVVSGAGSGRLFVTSKSKRMTVGNVLQAFRVFITLAGARDSLQAGKSKRHATIYVVHAV